MIKRRFALSIKYNGFFYNGWQRQSNFNSVQEKIEDSFYNVLKKKIIIYSSGRTDKGVHSLGQIAHCDLFTNMNNIDLLNNLNYHLPLDIRINYITEVDPSFDARHSVICREYKYVVYNSNINSVFLNNLVFMFNYRINVNKILYGIEYLLGYHDFCSFKSSGSKSSLSYKTIYGINISSHKNFLIFNITANSFLYKMVRTIIGILLILGSFDLDIEWLKYFIESKDLLGNKYIAPAHGLYLTNVVYSDKYNLSKINCDFLNIFYELL